MSRAPFLRMWGITDVPLSSSGKPFTNSPGPNQDDTRAWRERIMFGIYLTAILVGTVSLVSSSRMAIQNGYPYLIAIYVLAYSWAVVIAFARRIPFHVRAWSGLFLFYSLGLAALVTGGPGGSGRLWLFAFSVVATLLLGLRAGLLTLGLNAITLLTSGLLMNAGLLQWPVITPSLRVWHVGTFTFVFLNTVVTVSLAMLVRGLGRGLTKKQELTTKLTASNEQLIQEMIERKRVEEALRENEQKFRSLVEVTSDWVWEVDQEGTYTYASPKIRELLGYEPEEVIGKTPFDLMSDDEAERLSVFFSEKARSSEAFESLENTNLHKDGRSVVLETSAVPILDKDGNLLGYRGIDRDITERKRMESHIHQSGRMAAIGELATGVAHEINNPIAAIDVQTGLMHEVLDEEKGRMDTDFAQRLDDYLRSVELHVRRCQSVTGDLLSFARSPQDDHGIFQINDLLKNTIEFVMYLTDKKPNVETSLDVCLPLFWGNESRLQQVFVNLLTNAVKASDDDGTILIATYLDDGENICIEFRDEGCGIPGEIRDRIFDPFVTTSPPGEGTGLGLSICYYIVREMKGRIEVKGFPEAGTAFTVVLPNPGGGPDDGCDASF